MTEYKQVIAIYNIFALLDRIIITKAITGTR